MLSEINDIKLDTRVHVNIRTRIVNWSSVCWRTMRVKPTLVTIPYHRHSSRRCQPEYSVLPIRKHNLFRVPESFHFWTEWTFGLLFVYYLEESCGAITIATASGNIIWKHCNWRFRVYDFFMRKECKSVVDIVLCIYVYSFWNDLERFCPYLVGKVCVNINGWHETRLCRMRLTKWKWFASQ